ncbi:uncharacterized protein BT62DRAFT_1010318 [Guyanagaster necrorhizus]|uniref:Uncharacterized protein n=1 Tax=Guyanagaster necrorhizus TaxID=856835 RepID=A0A9P7VM24_9AGAR|nr:uncharacterized protein BT62DRAFT_1010318 [Guyanagaster necrorhizus MCA 3950]KAG7442394.1 hypothetical protein BT62DRAFT_1010318 [Guyanagaster necrorhizus MCA 3950]
MDFSTQTYIPPPYSVVDPFLSNNQQHSSQSTEPALWSNFLSSVPSATSEYPCDESKPQIPHWSQLPPSSTLPPSAMGVMDLGGRPAVTELMFPSSLSNGPIPMDFPDTGSLSTGWPHPKALSQATDDCVVEEIKPSKHICDLCPGPLKAQKGRWLLCPKCTYSLLNRPEEPNPLIRNGGKATFKCVYPSEDFPVKNHIDESTGVCQALYAMYLYYLREESALHIKDGLTHTEFQILVKTNASRRAYTDFGIEPPMSSGEEEYDTFGDDDDVSDYEF